MDTLRTTGLVERARAKWHHRGDLRPGFATQPGPGQESVWDYPRPPRLVADPRLVEVRHGASVLVTSRRAMRVLETASPPTWYLPPSDVDVTRLSASGRRSHCEWKGEATDFALEAGPSSVAWCYPRTYPEFAAIAGWIAFYPGRVACFVDGERVRPQPGGFYGGWVTDDVVGPFKGEPGSEGW